MKKLLKVMLPTVCFVSFVFTVLLFVSSCESAGTKCSKCQVNMDCQSGHCVDQLNGTKKCENGNLPFCG